MPHVSELIKRAFRTITCRRQKQPDIPTQIRSPAAGQSLWDRAYDALAKEKPGLVKDYEQLLASEQMANSVPNETTPSLPALHGSDTRPDRSRRLDTVIQNGLKRMDDNRTTFTIAGHEFVLKDQITTAAKFLLWGKEWIDTAVKASPEASLVWSGVCLIFPFLTNPTTAAEANQDGFFYVTSRMRYYVALEPLLRRLSQNARVDEALISAANEHIVDLYQTILDFQLSSVLRFYQSYLKTYVRDIVPLKDWNRILLCIKTQEEIVNSVLGQINDLAATERLEILNKTSEKTRATMEDCLSLATHQLTVSKKQLTVAEKQLAALEDDMQERLLVKRRKCLQEFCLTENGQGVTYEWYKNRVESRVEGTCNWFLQHDTFRKWLSQHSGPLLVSADPGCGKTVLAKYLIDDGLAQQSATVCYFFFQDQDQNTVRQALCALLHRLFFQKSALIHHAMGLYNVMGADLVQSEPLLWSILRDAVRDPQTGPLIFVIDALDECDESQLSSLISNLKDMFCDQQLADAKFKVLMTSRPYQQVVDKFESLQNDFQQILIPAEEEFEAISQDINRVTQHRVRHLAQKHRLSDKIKSSLNSQLLAINHRTYLWVYLVFNYLDDGFNNGSEKTEAGISAIIKTLPKNVNEAYDRILNRFQDDETVNIVKKILSIILAARRPLTLSEMNIAMNLDGPGRSRSIYDLDLDQDVDIKSRLRALCGPFLNVHHDRIYFLHQTARGFLIQSPAPTTVSSNLQWHHSITTRYAHSVFAEVCMFYLDRLNSTDTEAFSQDDHHSALLDYSVKYWGDHCREAEFEQGSVMVDFAARLCTPDLASNSQWAGIISDRYHIRPASIINVLVASHLGLTPVTELLLGKGADIEASNSWGSTALLIAAEFGYEPVTQLLLENGANVEAKNNDGWTPLLYAARFGHEPVTRLLLENSADIEVKDEGGRTALMLAAGSGDEIVTRVLLENGADVEAKNNDGWTPLMYAAESGHEPVTWLLLENGADVEAKNDDGWTPLMYAAKSGHESVTWLLLVKFHADIEAKNNDDWTPLMVAAELSHEPVIPLLVKCRTDVEAKTNDGWTLLMYAARYGHVPVTQLLLEYGAVDVEAKNKDGWTALMLAAGSGDEAVTGLLLDNGADMEAKGEGGRTPLMVAAEFDHESVSRLLLNNGANVEAKDEGGMTALMLAARYGEEAVIWLMLENGADIEAKNNKGWTPLMYAAKYGDEAVTRVLLENGANIETREDDGWTALMLAAGSGDEAVIRLLLDNGANIEAKGDGGRTPLMVAAEVGHEPVIRLLFGYGANVEAKDEGGRTALMFAAEFGHETVTRLLLEHGANVEVEDSKGLTALRHAVNSTRQLLLGHGARI